MMTCKRLQGEVQYNDGQFAEVQEAILILFWFATAMPASAGIWRCGWRAGAYVWQKSVFSSMRSQSWPTRCKVSRYRRGKTSTPVFLQGWKNASSVAGWNVYSFLGLTTALLKTFRC